LADILRGLSLTVQLFQGELLGFSDEAEYHEPGDKVEASIEADYSWVSTPSQQYSVVGTYMLQWES
jgi:hypothetical protein